MPDNMDGNKKEVTIKLAKTAGFCFGVKRAVNTVYELGGVVVTP